MTVSPAVPPLAFDNLADAVSALRGSGLRLSTARRLILEALFAAEGPVSAPYLVRHLKIDESSVYRNLEVLEQHGLIRHVHLGHSPGLYVLVSEAEVEYLYCDRCAKVTAVPPDRLQPVRDQIQHEFGYSVRFAHFAIVGLCADCAAAAPAAQSHSSRGHAHTADADRQSDQTPPRGDRAESPEHGAESPDHGAESPEHGNLHSHGDHVHSHPHSTAGRHEH